MTQEEEREKKKKNEIGALIIIDSVQPKTGLFPTYLVAALFGCVVDQSLCVRGKNQEKNAEKKKKKKEVRVLIFILASSDGSRWEHSRKNETFFTQTHPRRGEAALGRSSSGRGLVLASRGRRRAVSSSSGGGRRASVGAIVAVVSRRRRQWIASSCAVAHGAWGARGESERARASLCATKSERARVRMLACLCERERKGKCRCSLPRRSKREFSFTCLFSSSFSSPTLLSLSLSLGVVFFTL